MKLNLQSFVAVGLLMAAGCDSYPIDVCPCSHICKSNSSEICLCEKAGLVTLGPIVDVERVISSQNVVLSNRLNSDAKAAMTETGRFGDGYRRKYQQYKEGYYLHRCSNGPCIYLGANRDDAVAAGGMLSPLKA